MLVSLPRWTSGGSLECFSKNQTVRFRCERMDTLEPGAHRRSQKYRGSCVTRELQAKKGGETRAGVFPKHQHTLKFQHVPHPPRSWTESSRSVLLTRRDRRRHRSMQKREKTLGSLPAPKRC